MCPPSPLLVFALFCHSKVDTPPYGVFSEFLEANTESYSGALSADTVCRPRQQWSKRIYLVLYFSGSTYPIYLQPFPLVLLPSRLLYAALPFSLSFFMYAIQLKNYEQAVIEKRFSELEEEEVDALLDEVNEQ